MSKIKSFVKIVNDLKLFNIFAKWSTLDVKLGSEYTSVYIIFWHGARLNEFISPSQKLQITYLQIYSHNIYSQVYEVTTTKTKTKDMI